MIDLAATRGYTLLSAQLEPAAFIRRKADRYARAARAAGHSTPLNNITVARYVYLADSRKEAMDDLRPDITYELGAISDAFARWMADRGQSIAGYATAFGERKQTPGSPRPVVAASKPAPFSEATRIAPVLGDATVVVQEPTRLVAAR